MKIAVYGVFIGDRCIYVGRSSNMEIRKTAHTRRFRKLFSEPPQVRTLKTVSLESSAEVEWSMIRLYKDLEQADFNSDPGFNHRTAELPKADSRIERGQRIIELVQQGHPRKEIAELLNISQTEISVICRANNIWSLAGRKKGSGVGYGLKLTRAQHEEILRRDDRNESHAAIGKLIGVSRERIRQVCVAAGHPTRRARQLERIAREREQQTLERAQRRLLKRITPTEKTLAFANLWQEGKTLSEVASNLGLKQASVCTRLAQLRARHPALFPYRRPEHLRWMGRNFRSEASQRRAAA